MARHGQMETEVSALNGLDFAWKALADPIRRSLLETLTLRQHFCYVDGQLVEGICVQDLSAILQLPQSTVSRHLTILRQAGLVHHQQKGVWHYYGCQTRRLQALQQWLADLCQPESGAADLLPDVTEKTT
ncbi:MAG: metalloregulator ArsR/SmtB family transcription factor [Firmicutes bacterium]|nr:metalloregulator ArsR/SmtB family transcription factor [Bacillota bacterium]